MSIARNFIARAREIEEDHAQFADPSDAEFMAEDFDNAIVHSVIDQRRAELSVRRRVPIWPLPDYLIHILTAVTDDLTENKEPKEDAFLHPIDYHRSTAALTVAIAEYRSRKVENFIDLTPAPKGWEFVEA